MKRFTAALLIVASLLASGCKDREVVYVQAPAQQVVAPVAAPMPMAYEDHHMTAGDAALVAGSVVAGAMVADYLINGRPRPGYLVMDGRVYRDTPSTRNVYKHTTVINKTVIINKAPAAPAAAPAAAKPASPAPVAQPNVKKEAPGDAAAKAERAKMDAEAAQKQKQADLKAQLKAKQEARQAAQTPKAAPINLSKPNRPSGGFNQMSRSASSGRRK